VERLGLTVTNNSGASIRPAFTIEDGLTVTAFWRRTGGPAVLGPHQQAHYTIEAPSYFAMPSIATASSVAFGQHPGSVSRTGAYQASLWRMVLLPSTVSHRSPGVSTSPFTPRSWTGSTTGLRGQRAVYLGQVIYAQRGLEFSQAMINRACPARPDPGQDQRPRVASFTIRSPVGGADPVYFEANLVKPGSPTRTVTHLSCPCGSGHDRGAPDRLRRVRRAAGLLLRLERAALPPVRADLRLRRLPSALVPDRTRRPESVQLGLGIAVLAQRCEFAIWPLAAFYWVWPHDLVLLWLQDLGVVAAEALAFGWLCSWPGAGGPGGTRSCWR